MKKNLKVNHNSSLLTNSKIKTALAAVAVIAMCAVAPIQANATSDITIDIDGVTLQSEVAPFIENGTTMVPVRAIAEGLGAVVNWNASTQSVDIIREGRTITLQVEPGMIRSGTTFLGLRQVGELLGMAVDWNGATRTVGVNTAGQTLTPGNNQGNQINRFPITNWYLEEYYYTGFLLGREDLRRGLPNLAEARADEFFTKYYENVTEEARRNFIRGYQEAFIDKMGMGIDSQIGLNNPGKTLVVKKGRII